MLKLACPVTWCTKFARQSEDKLTEYNRGRICGSASVRPRNSARRLSPVECKWQFIIGKMNMFVKML